MLKDISSVWYLNWIEAYRPMVSSTVIWKIYVVKYVCEMQVFKIGSMILLYDSYVSKTSFTIFKNFKIG